MPIASCLCREWFGLQTAWNLSCSQHALSYSVPVRSLRIRATLLGVFNCGRRWQNADGRVRQMAERRWQNEVRMLRLAMNLRKC